MDEIIEFKIPKVFNAFAFKIDLVVLESSRSTYLEFFEFIERKLSESLNKKLIETIKTKLFDFYLNSIINKLIPSLSDIYLLSKHSEGLYTAWNNKGKNFHYVIKFVPAGQREDVIKVPEDVLENVIKYESLSYWFLNSLFHAEHSASLDLVKELQRRVSSLENKINNQVFPEVSERDKFISDIRKAIHNIGILKADKSKVARFLKYVSPNSLQYDLDKYKINYTSKKFIDKNTGEQII